MVIHKNRVTPQPFFTVLVLIILFLTAGSQVVSALNLPSEIGSIERRLPGNNGRTLYLIQESHVDYEAQKAILQILETLIYQTSLRLILVEGGWDDVSLKEFREIGNADGRRIVAEKFLKEGKITAEEFLDITTEHPLILWGVEDPKLYKTNTETFLKYRKQESETLRNLGKIEALLDSLKGKVLSRELEKLIHQRAAYHKRAMSLADYLILLKNAGSDDLSRYPLLQKILSALGAGEFDVAKVKHEAGEIFKSLSARRTKTELAELTEIKMNKGETSKEYYKELIDWAQQDLVIQNKFKADNLKGFLALLTEIESAPSRRLMQELQSLETEVLSGLPKSEDEQLWMEMSLKFETVEKTLELKLNPDLYQDNIAKEQVNGFIEGLPSLYSLAETHGVVYPEEAMREQLKESLDGAFAFYASAVSREKAIIDNTLKKLNEINHNVAALIAGGFHNEVLREGLHKEGFTIVNITPRFTPEDSEEHQEKYFEVLKYKLSNSV